MNKELTLLEPHELKHYNELKKFVENCNISNSFASIYPEMLRQARIDIDYYEELAAERAIDIVELCNTGSNIYLRFENNHTLFMCSKL